MKLYMTEHFAERTWPQLNGQVVEEGQVSKPLLSLTRSVRCHADDDCLIAFTNLGDAEKDNLAWTRLAGDATEWFDVIKDPRYVRVWMRAEE